MRYLRIAMIAWLLSLPSYAMGSPVSAPLPLDSWIYPALEKLEGLGLIDSALKGTRPYTRIEASRLILEARDKADTTQPPPVAFEILRQLERELRSSLDEARGLRAATYFQPLREVRLDYIHHDSLLSTPSPISRTNARQHALNPNNFGIDYSEGSNLHATIETEARFHRFFLVNWRPLFSVDDDQTQFRTLHGTATLGLGPINIIAGRDSLWWGQGRNGSLILTNNAKPLDMLRITNPTPVLLPWVFKHLGPIRFDVFWSELEEDRHIPEPYLAGLRINFKPRPWLEIGGSRTLIFGGEGRPKVEFSEFITILGGKNLSGEGDTSNQLAAIDARIILKPLWGAEIYGELGGEDEAGAFIAKKALLAGLYLPRIEPSGRLSLRLEYTDLNFQGNGRYWYNHSQWQSGYTYNKQILGHHIGGDARDYIATLEWYPGTGGRLVAGVNFQRRGLTSDTAEEHLQPFLGIEQPLLDRLRLSAHYSLDRVKNAGYLSGVTRTDHFVKVGLSRTW